MRWVCVMLCLIVCSSCSLAPRYHRPALYIPYTYKENVKWSRAKPHLTTLARGPWWKMYHDPVLNQLEAQLHCDNQNIKIALARFQQARAALNVAKAAYFPTILAVGNAFRQQTSGNVANKVPAPLFSDNLLSLNLQYEIDVWGRIRNQVLAARDVAKASAADIATITLSMETELASDYFMLRGDDAACHVLDQTVIAYQKALDLTLRRFKGGVSPIADVDQAKNQLETAKTAAADMRLRRAQLEHAIANLIGKPPAMFSILAKKYKPHLVTIAPDLPSTLLERRPDIASAELLVQSANANIGVARAAFFPAFNLSAGIGFESSMLSNLLRMPSLVWSIGPTTSSALLNNGSMPLITQTVFDGGRISALTDDAYAKYVEHVAAYRQTVLTAYQEVEDSLVALRQLDKEHHTQTAATRAANQALVQALYRYKGGLTTYLDVVVVQNIALQTELNNIDIIARRQVASVQLIKALGGGFTFVC